MAVIDAHVHLYPPEVGRAPAAWAEAAREAHWAALCTRRRKGEGLGAGAVQLFPTVTQLLHEMDAAGVEKSVLLGWYWEWPERCAWQNRFYAGCVRAHPDRLAAFATVHPAAGAGAFDELRRAKDDGLIGLGELSPHLQRVDPADPVWIAILRLAGELGLPVNLHVADPGSAPYPGRVETRRADFERWARECPATTFILAHWGGGLAFEAAGRELPNIHFDSAASPLMYGPDVWRRACDAVGPDRLLFGSDNPLRLYPKIESGVGLPLLVQEARKALLPDHVAPVLGGNARRLLGI
jgi:predicted TIM-barrel fold metal-dependent hydrolase